MGRGGAGGNEGEEERGKQTKLELLVQEGRMGRQA